MKIVFNAVRLQEKLKAVVRIIPASSKTDMYKFVRITADKEECKVEFETTSHDEYIRETLVDELVQSPAKIFESGSCLLSARELVAMVKRATDVAAEQVEIEVIKPGYNAILKFAKAEYRVNGVAPETFVPYRNDSEEANRIEITAVALRSLLTHVTYACATSEVKPMLQGVNFVLTEGNLQAVATDGLRLATRNAEGKTEGEVQGNVTIPKVPLEDMAAILPHDDDEIVTLELGNTALVATWDDEGTKFVMRALDGVYPDVDRIIPRSAKAQLRVSRTGLLNVCKNLALFDGDVENRQTHVKFEGGEMNMSIKSPTYGRAFDKVEYNGPENLEPRLFNIRFLMDMLNGFESDEVEIWLNDDRMPVTVHPVDGEGLALLSPILYRAQEEDIKQTA